DALVSAVGVSHSSGPDSAQIDRLPTVWRVRGSTRVFEIPTGTLQGDFREWTAGHDAAARRRLLDHLRTLRSDAVSFERPVPDREAQRALLSTILSKPEFLGIQGPTWMDRLKQRALRVIGRWLVRTLPASFIPTIGAFVVYALVVIAAVLAAWSAYGFFGRRNGVDSIATEKPMAPLREWSVWLADAQKAASLGDWRTAVHLT